MKFRFLLFAVLLFASCALFAAGDGFNAGVTNTGTNYFKEDLGKSFNKFLDVAVTFANISETSIVIEDTTAYLFDSNRIYAYDLNSGKESWKYPADKALDVNISCKPVAYENKIYFTTMDSLFCLDSKEGKVLWIKKIESTVSPIIKVSEGIIYISLDDGKIYRLSPADGSDAAEPLAVKKQNSGKNKMLINKDYIVTTQDNSLVCTDKKTGKMNFAVQIPSSAISFTPLLLDKYVVVTSGEQVVVYSLPNGREVGRRIMDEAVVTSPVTDGKYIYVPCFDSKVYALNFDKKLTVAWNDLETVETLESIIAVSDNQMIVADTKGLVSTYDLNTKSVIWQYQPGMYTQGGVTNQIPGMGNEDITAMREFTGNNGTSMNGEMGGPGGPGGRGGRGGRGMGAMRSLGLDEFLASVSSFEGTSVLAQGRGGRGGRGGMMGGNPGMGGMAENVPQKTITYVNVLTPNGNFYDVDMDKFYNDPGREFIPSPIISQPCYMNGFLGFISIDGHFRLRSLNTVDTKAPYIFEYVPGCAADNRVVSANADILTKIYVFDKGSGIDFRTAKLTVKDSKGKVFDIKMVYDSNKCGFYGYIRNSEAGAISAPFAEGKMDCEFRVKDYAGNELVRYFNFRADPSVAEKENNINSGKYFGVDSGRLYDIDFVDFSKGIISSEKKKVN